MSVTRIPYDSFALAAVVGEIRGFVGARVQGIRQPGETDLAIGLYAPHAPTSGVAGSGREAMLLLSCDPVFARAHFITKRPATLTPPPAFCSTLRARIDGSRLKEVRQVQGDRVLELSFETPDGVYRLIAELMGKHSNLVLVDPRGVALSAAKWVSAAKSRRPIQSGAPYAWPPVLSPGDELKPSPFYRSLATALGRAPTAGQSILSPGHGAYPTSVAVLALPELPRASISVALEQHFNRAIPEHVTASLRAALLIQLDRVALARETALGALRQALAAGGRAAGWQRWGELLLAYGSSAAAPTADGDGVARMRAWDYEGAEVQIPVNPDLDYKLNAQVYFDRAKKAKGSLGIVIDQIGRLAADLDAVASLRERVGAAERLDSLLELQEEAKRRRWLTTQAPPSKSRDERPYAGHRIRELAAPGGWTLLFGENAEANDHLTLRVARPNDWWLHVRGGTSAHVVIVTRNQPDRVQRETLEYAARVAVQHSPSKHGGYVPVDYTLKKYVRKPHGAAKGAALYSNEKTIHVDGG